MTKRIIILMILTLFIFSIVSVNVSASRHSYFDTFERSYCRSAYSGSDSELEPDEIRTSFYTEYKLYLESGDGLDHEIFVEVDGADPCDTNVQWSDFYDDTPTIEVEIRFTSDHDDPIQEFDYTLELYSHMDDETADTVSGSGMTRHTFQIYFDNVGNKLWLQDTLQFDDNPASGDGEPDNSIPLSAENLENLVEKTYENFEYYDLYYHDPEIDEWYVREWRHPDGDTGGEFSPNVGVFSNIMDGFNNWADDYIPGSLNLLSLLLFGGGVFLFITSKNETYFIMGAIMIILGVLETSSGMVSNYVLYLELIL